MTVPERILRDLERLWGQPREWVMNYYGITEEDE